MSEYQPHILLGGVAGSTAHGLAREGSDEDLHGVFAWPTDAFWEFDKPKETLDGHEPQDYSFHELEKFLRLAMANNPTILETLYLEDYKDKDYIWGQMLLNHREQFLHTKGVRNSYLGYAESQFRKIQARTDGTFSSDTKNRTAKHARHLFRLLEQAELLLTTGELSIRVANPQWYFELEDRPVTDWVDMYHGKEAELRELESVLPDEPDRKFWNDFLYSYREAH